MRAEVIMFLRAEYRLHQARVQLATAIREDKTATRAILDTFRALTPEEQADIESAGPAAELPKEGGQ